MWLNGCPEGGAWWLDFCPWPCTIKRFINNLNEDEKYVGVIQRDLLRAELQAFFFHIMVLMEIVNIVQSTGEIKEMKSQPKVTGLESGCSRLCSKDWGDQYLKTQGINIWATPKLTTAHSFGSFGLKRWVWPEFHLRSQLASPLEGSKGGEKMGSQITALLLAVLWSEHPVKSSLRIRCGPHGVCLRLRWCEKELSLFSSPKQAVT